METVTVADGEEKISGSNSYWSKQQIYQLMKTSPERVTFQENDHVQQKSETWAKFKVVHVDKIPVDYVKCNDCIVLFRWTPRLGTTSLLRHKCVIPELKQSGSVSGDKGQLLLTQMMSKKVPPSAITALNDSIVIGLAKDLQPLHTVESKGFLKICQSLINFGAKFGNQDASKLIRCRRTMKDVHLTKIADSVRNSLKEQISKLSAYPRYSFTFDMWTETRKQRHFLSFTCHFIDANFTLQSSLMSVQEFPNDLKKTQANIKNQCKELLKLYFTDENAVERVINDSIAVTDGGSNVKGVFPTRLPCMCHRINLVLDHTFSESNLKSHPEISLALSTLKSFVKYFKKSGLNSQLKCSLKQSVSTRWNSEVIMIESYVKSSSEVQAILLEKKQLQRISGLNETLLSDLLKLIQPFKAASEELSAEKRITVDKVVPTFFLLSQHLEPNEEDDSIINLLKCSMKKWFVQYYTLEKIHIAATALNPRFKSLKLVSPDAKEAAHNFIREKLVQFNGIKHENGNQPDESSGLEPKPPKRSRMLSLRDLEDSGSDEDMPETDELTIYLQSRLSKHEKTTIDVLEYWKFETKFPVLRLVALWLLAVPASEAADERTFSVTGQTISDRRSQLGSKTVNDLTMINKNLEL